MIEVERNVQVADERGERADGPGRCRFTIRGARPKPAPGARTGPDISTKQTREQEPCEIYMDRYY
ncbi:MAG: hypothetical protein AB1916_06590 [Thermodesulfobacteriota bacterium]